MNDARDLLTETFAAHEHLTPDGAEVLTNVEAIARVHRRNRWVVRATGVSLVGAGIVAGSIAVPGLVSHSPSHGSRVTAADGTDTTYTQEQELNAYFQGGYDYNNAVELEKLWKMSPAFPNKVKAKAGLELLEGQTLPVTPDATPATPEDKAVSAFFAAGYDYNDAVTLAKRWHDKETYQAKVTGGQKLENGETLPIPPSDNASSGSTATPVTPSSAALKRAKLLAIRRKDAKPLTVANSSAAGSSDSESPALTAYFNAGYDYNDALKLSKIWHETDVNQVKSQAGQKLLDGDTLPVKPSGTPAPPDNKAVDTFFADGYDYNDAVRLGQMWHLTDTYQVKIKAGQKLENGQTLPIPPSS